MIYEIKRNGVVIAAVRASGGQERSVMAIDRVPMSFTLPNGIDFKRGDTVEVYGQTYKINRLPNDYKTASSLGIRYELEFEALYYDLGKWQLKGLDAQNNLTLSEVYVVGNASVIIDLIVRNANRVDPGWTVGIVEETDTVQFSYSNQSLLSVLQDAASRFNSEFWVEGKTINFSKREQSSGLTLEYGKGKGLYELARERTDKVAINRLYVEGGTRNIPYDYGFSRLQLPLANRPFLESDPLTGDVVEHTEIFENIYPSRTGTLTGIGANELTFSDSSLDFDINGHLTESSAIISFTSGQLSGFEFTIAEYIHASKTFVIHRANDSAYPDGVPNVLLKPAIGDKYVLLNINLPQAYITANENRLLEAGNNYLINNNTDKFTYRASLSPIWVKELSPLIDLGYTVVLKDIERGIDQNIRISAYTRDLQEDYRYTSFTLSDTIAVSNYAKEYARQTKVTQAINSGILDKGSNVWNLQKVTEAGKTTNRVIEAEGLEAKSVLSIPETGPTAPKADKTYLHFGALGQGSEQPPSGAQELKQLDDVDSNLNPSLPNQAGSTLTFLGWNNQTNKWEAKQGDYIPMSQKGVANGVATLGTDGILATPQRPASELNWDDVQW